MASQQITQVINDTINHYDKELRDISLKVWQMQKEYINKYAKRSK